MPVLIPPPTNVVNTNDYSQSMFCNIMLGATPSFIPIPDDVREIKVTAWPVSKRFLPINQNENYSHGALIRLTNYKAFQISGNSDGSYTAVFRYRLYVLAGQVYSTYVLIDPSNNDEKGSQPRLLTPNISFGATGESSTFALIFTDYFTQSLSEGQPQFEYGIAGAFGLFGGGGATDENTRLIPINRNIYYTTDGSTPNLGSPSYNPDSPPILPAGGTYTIQAFVNADGWLPSPIQSVTITVPANIGQSNTALGAPAFSFSIGNIGNPGFNSDGPFTYFTNILVSIAPSTDPGFTGTTNTIYYSLDGGITFQTYTGPFHLPSGWKTPVGNAGFPNIIAYQQDEKFNRSVDAVVPIYISYPNKNITFSYVGSPIEYNAASTDVTLGGQGTSYANNVKGLFTTSDDFRYFEVKASGINNTTDPNQAVTVFVNNLALEQNGSIVDQNNSQTLATLPSLVWGTNDVIRVIFDYTTGAVMFAINNGDFSDFYISSSPNIKLGMSNNSQGGFTAPILSFMFTAAQFTLFGSSHPEVNGGLFPIDTTNWSPPG